MNRKYLLMAGMLVMLGAVLLLTRIQAAPAPSPSQSATPTPHLDGYATILFNQSRGTFLPIVPTVSPEKYTDLAPELSLDMKVAVSLRHADGTRERFDIARSMLYAFIRKLPREVTVIHIDPIYPASGGYLLSTLATVSPTPSTSMTHGTP